MLRLFATVANGLEDVAASEIERITGRSVAIGVGKVFFCGDEETIFKVNMLSRTVNRVMILLHHDRLDDISLDKIYSAAKLLNYRGIIDPNQSFAVRARRVGTHNFTSVDVASQVGQAIIDSYLKERGYRLRVNLDNPDIEFIAIVRNDEFILGLNTTGESLHKRHYRVYNHPAALNTTIASAMIMISGWRPDESMLDPMCGGGTIPIEAALTARTVPPGYFRMKDFAFLKFRFINLKAFDEVVSRTISAMNHEYSPIYGMDENGRYLEGAIMNAESAGVRDTISFMLGDATRLKDHLDFSPRYVVTNPPYGIRMRKGRMEPFYRGFLESLKEVAEGSTLTLITALRKKFLRAAEAAEISIVEKREVLHGEIRTTIFKCII